MTDETLVEKALTGDERAFSKLVDRPSNYLSKSLRDRERARDLTQRAWMRVWRHLHRFDPDRASFAGWIHTIADRLARNEIRDRGRSPEELFQQHREAREREGIDRPLQWGDTSRSPERETVKRQLVPMVQQAVAELPDIYRPAFELREFEGLTYEEIAEELDLPLGTVKSRMRRARMRFADSVEPKLEGLFGERAA